MRINLPLNQASERNSLVSSSAKGLKLNLPINLSAARGVRGIFSSTRQVQVLRAVAAAASVHKADEALKKVKEALESPESVIVPNLAEEKLDELIQTVKVVLDNPSEGQRPTAEQTAAARAIGADPVLVRAAYDKMAESDDYLFNGLAWVAAVDAKLLDRSAREGTRRLMLDKVPARQDLITLRGRIETLEDKVKELQQQCASAKPAAKPSTGKGSV